MFAGLVLAWLAGAAAASGPTPSQANVERMCRLTTCQHGLHVALKQQDGTLFEKTYDVFPAIVQEAGILVVAGQTVYVEADVEDGRLVNLRAVDAVVHPEKTITAHLEQSADGGMLLTLRNPFKAALKFRMGMMPLASDALYATSSCPVVAGGGSYEMWPYPIFQVLLGEGRLLGDGDDLSCA
ncbi:MAG: hypothetical protein ACTHKZ_10595 [Lysobacteraceae bacterium]